MEGRDSPTPSQCQPVRSIKYSKIPQNIFLYVYYISCLQSHLYLIYTNYCHIHACSTSIFQTIIIISQSCALSKLHIRNSTQQHGQLGNRTRYIYIVKITRIEKFKTNLQYEWTYVDTYFRNNNNIMQ